jgi:hypothetical protein
MSLFVPQVGNPRPEQFDSKHAHLVIFLYGDVASSHSQTETDKITLSHFNPFNRLIYSETAV